MFSQIFAYNKCPLFRTTFTIDTTGNLCDFLFKDWHSAQGIHTSVCVRIYQGSLWADTSGTDKSRNHLKIRKNSREKTRTVWLGDTRTPYQWLRRDLHLHFAAVLLLFLLLLLLLLARECPCCCWYSLAPPVFLFGVM